MRGGDREFGSIQNWVYKERGSLEKRMLITSVSQIFKPTSNQHAAEATYQKRSTRTTNSVTFEPRRAAAVQPWRLKRPPCLRRSAEATIVLEASRLKQPPSSSNSECNTATTAKLRIRYACKRFESQTTL